MYGIIIGRTGRASLQGYWSADNCFYCMADHIFYCGQSHIGNRMLKSAQNNLSRRVIASCFF